MMELVAVVEIDGTVMKHRYAVAYAAILMATRYWEEPCTETIIWMGAGGHSETDGGEDFGRK